jgi:hypothetical protein
VFSTRSSSGRHDDHVVHPRRDPHDVVVRGFLRPDVGTADGRDLLAGRAVERLIALIRHRMTLAAVREPDPLVRRSIPVVRVRRPSGELGI